MAGLLFWTEWVSWKVRWPQWGFFIVLFVRFPSIAASQHLLSVHSTVFNLHSIAFRNKVWTEQRSWENGLPFPFEGPGLRKLLCSKVSYVQVKLFSLSSFSTRTQTDYWSHKQTKEEGKSLTQQWLVVVCKGLVNGSCPFWNSLFLALFHRHLHTVFFNDSLEVLEKRG